MRRFAVALAVLAACAACAARAAADAPTFTKDVAPILWKNCAGCHHTGHVAPFSLLTYKDAARRAKFLAEVTASRRMPPWRAAPDYGPHFMNERRMSDADIKTLAQWAEAGAPEGEPKDLPPMPKFPEGWQLGTPDLVVKMPEPFTVPAGGPDVYRCFIIPLPVDEDKTVSAVEFRPGNKRLIHHAGFHLDNKGQARKRDREDGKPGYTSVGSPGFSPTGSLGGWGLAGYPRFLPPSTGMPLAKGSDLVLQIHYHPSGKEEQDQSEVGIYFSKKPATRFVTRVSARQTKILIPAGDKRHRITAESAPLPVDVELWMVSNHMHILGRESRSWAELPDGKIQPFVWIKDWDFHWAERYELATPMKLPKGTVIKVEGYYDNSADNPRNPNSPPKDVRYGNNLTDEMLGCSLQVIVPTMVDLRTLEAMRGSRSGPGPSKEPSSEKKR
jgi:hypothetical protein